MERLGNQISALQEELKALKQAAGGGAGGSGQQDAKAPPHGGSEVRRPWLDALSSSQMAQPGQHHAGGSVSRLHSNNLVSLHSESMSNILLSAKSSRQSSYAEVPVSVTAPDSYGGQHLPFSSGSVPTSAAAQHVSPHVGNSAVGSPAVVASSTGQALKVLERVLAGRKVRDTGTSQSRRVLPSRVWNPRESGIFRFNLR